MTIKSHRDRLNRMARDTAQEVARKLYLAGQEIELEARRSIVAGSVSGAGHVPSAPGQPPSNDTGLLQRSIETELQAQNPPTVTVTSYAPYSAHLEYGTAKMSPRPFMRVATERKRALVVRLVGEAVSIVIKRG